MTPDEEIAATVARIAAKDKRYSRIDVKPVGDATRSPRPRPKAFPPYPCTKRGEPTGEKIGCRTCDNAKLTIFACEIHGECTIEKLPKKSGVQCCKHCPSREPPDQAGNSRVQLLSIGVPQMAKPTLDPRLAGMKSPRDRRQVWRGGVLQIWTTRACDRSCFGCTQGSNLAGKPEFITPDQFRVACESLKGYFGVIGVFGGNPSIHPQFDELCKIMRGTVPWEQRGLWSNHPRGKGKTCRITFNPAYSNLNVHQSQEAYDEFARDWPECRPYLKGLDSDSRHSPPFVAMKDVIQDEAERWKLISNCDINQNWSAMICVFRGQLRGYFCEIAASQAMLHQHEPDYPDLGVPIVPGWWNQGMEVFQEQVKKHCHDCGIPLRGHGALANDESGTEQVSETHRAVYEPKRKGRKVEVVTELIQLGSPLKRTTDYIENGSIL